MSLTWNLENIKDWENVCRESDGTLNPVTHNTIMGMMGVGMGSITEANTDEVAWRFDLYQRMFGPLVVEVEDGDFVPRPINAADIRAHIGLHTNVTTETRAKWVKRTMDWDFTEHVRNNREKERA